MLIVNRETILQSVDVMKAMMVIPLLDADLKIIVQVDHAITHLSVKTNLVAMNVIVPQKEILEIHMQIQDVS